jgi:hypothetical protein
VTLWNEVEALLPKGGRLAVQGRGDGTYEAWAQDTERHEGLGFGYGRTPDEALAQLRDKLLADRK